jgi:hypothetical protein
MQLAERQPGRNYLLACRRLQLDVDGGRVVDDGHDGRSQRILAEDLPAGLGRECRPWRERQVSDVDTAALRDQL